VGHYWICSIVYVVSLHFTSLQLVFMCSVLFCSCAGISCPFSFSCSCSSYVNVSSAYHVIIYQGRTALHWACSRANTDIAQLLISYGADPTIKDGVWLIWIIECDYVSIIHICLRYRPVNQPSNTFPEVKKIVWRFMLTVSWYLLDSACLLL
jgi:hypothetical protein